MEKSQTNLSVKIIIVVGLIITFALLFFSVKTTWENKEHLVSFAELCKKGVLELERVWQETKTENGTEEQTKPLVDPNLPMIALTFDDGPSIYTDEILNILQANDARASFFVLGDRAVKYPETIAKIEAIYCEIGNHSYSHLDLTKLLPEQVVSEIGMTNDAVRNVVGHDTMLLRPPYGAVNEIVVANIAAPIVLWSVDTTDWQTKDANAVAQHILATAQDGDVVLLHDIYGTTLEAMRVVIPELKARGYQLVTFSEMAKARGVALQNGQKYYHFKQ